MRKIRYSLAVISVLLINLGAACSSAAQPPNAAPSVAQTGGGTAAPKCQVATTCQAPTADQAKIGCVKKIPYTNVSVPQGTTFEVVDKSGSFTCVDSDTVVRGKEVLTCHGKQLYAFDLKLTSTACGGAALTTGGGQCQQGYGYDAAQQCCAPVTGGSGNSTTVTVALGACPLPSQ